jgi:hypothetical protein
MEKDGVEVSQSQQYTQEPNTQALISEHDSDEENVATDSEVELEADDEEGFSETKEFAEVEKKLQSDDTSLYMMTMYFLIDYEKTNLDDVLNYIERIQKNKTKLDETLDKAFKKNKINLSRVKCCILNFKRKHYIKRKQ